MGHDLPAEAQLVLYWFPTSPAEARNSPLVTSRGLSMASEALVRDHRAHDNKTLRTKYSAPEADQLLVLAEVDGTEVTRFTAQDGKLDVRSVEKSVKAELDKREDSAEAALKQAEAGLERRQDGGHRCLPEDLGRALLSSYGKKAAKALKKLGAQVETRCSASLDPSYSRRSQARRRTSLWSAP